MKTIKYIVYVWMALALTLLATACSTEGPECPETYNWVIDSAELRGTPYNYEVHIFAHKGCSGEEAHFMSDYYRVIEYFMSRPERFEAGQIFQYNPNTSNYIRIY